MAISGSYNYSMTRNDILYEALHASGVIGPGETPPAHTMVSAARLLNLMVKAWSIPENKVLPGVKFWARKKATLIPQYGDGVYSLGPSGDHGVESSSLIRTSLSADASSGATSVDVASIVGIGDNYLVGVGLDDSTIQWSTVNGSPSGSTVAIDDALTGDASSGNVVFAYTSTAKMVRPIELLSVLLRNSDGEDVPLSPMYQPEYAAIASKLSTGDPTRYYYEGQLVNGLLYLDNCPDKVTSTLEITYQAPFQDFDVLTDEPDFPQQYWEAILYNLAKRICVAWGIPVPQDLMAMASDSLLMAGKLNPKNVDIWFEPGRD